MSTKTPDEVQVIEPPRPGKRRFYSAQEKLNFLQEAEAPGSRRSAVARRYGISPSQLFRWRRFRPQQGYCDASDDGGIEPVLRRHADGDGQRHRER